MAASEVLFGGLSATGDMGDTWVYNNTSGWYRGTSPAPSPSPRHGHVMGHIRVDVGGGCCVSRYMLFGGSGSAGYLADTWVFGNNAVATSGDSWTNVTPATSPSAREFAAAAEDPLLKGWVLFGGRNGSGDLNDTWVWNGTTWAKKSPATSPPPRHSAFLATASTPTGPVAVLFGGRSAAGVLGDTWTWDGVTWTQVAPTPKGPQPRYGAASGGGRWGYAQYLIGGNTGSGVVGDQWKFNGSAWVKLTGPAPPAREYAAGGLYRLFGGRSGASFLSDTWRLDFPDPCPPKGCAGP